MREPGAIRHKAKQVRFRHLKQLLEEALAQTPDNCLHNRKFHHPQIVVSGGPPVGVCVCPAQDGDVLCDKAWGGTERARVCPLFEPTTTKEEVKQEYRDFLATADLARIANTYPDLAALMWVLQEEEADREVDFTEVPEPPRVEEAALVKAIEAMEKKAPEEVWATGPGRWVYVYQLLALLPAWLTRWVK